MQRNSLRPSRKGRNCEEVYTMKDLITVDIDGYLEGEKDPGCVTLAFDLDGKEVALDGSK